MNEPGILRADVVQEFSRTILFPVTNPADARRKAKGALRELQRRANSFLGKEGFATRQRRFEHRLDIRYLGQAYDLSIPDSKNYVAEFHKAHARAYGHADPTRAIEIVTVRCRAIGVSPDIDLPRLGRSIAVKSTHTHPAAKCFFGGRLHQASLYEREKLGAGTTFNGPAIIVEYSATSLVPPGWRAKVDAYGQIHLSKRDKARQHVR